MDGVDAALVRLSGTAERPRVELLEFLTVSYHATVRRKLLRVAAGEPSTSGEISGLNFALGETFARAALAVCRRARVPTRHVNVIGSHGQTVFHRGVAEKSPADPASTLQIAEPAVITERTGIPVVADFRTADVAAGGQGAPLVPMVDYLLLRSERECVVALNIGGIANFTVIPARARERDVFGFDTGPGNMLIDGLMRRLTRGRPTYDRGGRRAARGQVIEPLLDNLLAYPFFSKRPPKSAGREQFGDAFLEHFFLARPHHFEDLLRTATELTARTIADALWRFVPPRVRVSRLVLSGGGAHNSLLVRRLAEQLPQLTVELSDRYGLPVDAKEAIAFAVLADRTLQGLPGNLPRVTGARRSVVLGKICRP